MAKHISHKGRVITCWLCDHEYEIREKYLSQPSYEVSVFCPECGGRSESIWSTHSRFYGELNDRSMEDIFLEAIEVFGFVPRYDYDGDPITFTCNIHKDRDPGEGYDLVIDFQTIALVERKVRTAQHTLAGNTCPPRGE